MPADAQRDPLRVTQMSNNATTTPKKGSPKSENGKQAPKSKRKGKQQPDAPPAAPAPAPASASKAARAPKREERPRSQSVSSAVPTQKFFAGASFSNSPNPDDLPQPNFSLPPSTVPTSAPPMASMAIRLDAPVRAQSLPASPPTLVSYTAPTPAAAAPAAQPASDLEGFLRAALQMAPSQSSKPASTSSSPPMSLSTTPPPYAIPTRDLAYNTEPALRNISVVIPTTQPTAAPYGTPPTSSTPRTAPSALLSPGFLSGNSTPTASHGFGVAAAPSYPYGAAPYVAPTPAFYPEPVEAQSANATMELRRLLKIGGSA